MEDVPEPILHFKFRAVGHMQAATSFAIDAEANSISAGLYSTFKASLAIANDLRRRVAGIYLLATK
jgi:hypothetical protein